MKPKSNKSVIRRSVNRRFKETRAIRRLTMKGAAELIGVSASSLANFESGKTKPQGRTMDKVNSWLNNGHAVIAQRVPATPTTTVMQVSPVNFAVKSVLDRRTPEEKIALTQFILE